jgi:hypothetical protein
VPVDTGDSPLYAVTYTSDKMLPGEELTLMYSGVQTDFNFIGAADVYEYNAIILKSVLQSSGGAFTSFGGVELQRENRGETTMVLQAPPVPGGNIPSLVETDCGDAQIGTIPALALGNNYTDLQPACVNACFRTLGDLQAESSAVSCDSGEGEWVLSLVIGALRERSEEPWRYNAVQASNVLIVRAKTAQSEHFYIPVDDVLRNALWSDQGLSQDDIWLQQIEDFSISSLDHCGGSPSLLSYGASDWEVDRFNSDANSWVECLKDTANGNAHNLRAFRDSLNAEGCCTNELTTLMNDKVGQVNDIIATADAMIGDFDERIRRNNASMSSYHDSGASYGDDSYSSYDDGYSSYDDGDSYDSGSYESYDSGSGGYSIPFDMPTILPGMN